MEIKVYVNGEENSFVFSNLVGSISGFGLSKEVSKRLLEMGLKREDGEFRFVRGQMIYNYLEKGYIKRNEKGLIDGEEGERWMKKYLGNIIYDLISGDDVVYINGEIFIGK